MELDGTVIQLHSSTILAIGSFAAASVVAKLQALGGM